MASFFLLMTIVLALLCHTQADFAGHPAISPSARSISNGNPVAQAKSAAQASIAAARSTSQVAMKYASGSTKGKAETCIETCGDAIDNLNQCLAVLKSFRGSPLEIGDLKTWGSAALSDVGTCNDEFGSGEPADLKNTSENAYKNIIKFLTIVNSM